MKSGELLTDEVKRTINAALRSRYSPRHAPDQILEVSAIPYTLSGKKMEMPVKKVLMGAEPSAVASPDTMRDPEALAAFVGWQKSG
jgi:acetoacetyl-CoA synthetase